MKAVFFDRDGVLNRAVMRGGKPASPRSVSELELDEQAPAALDRLKSAGWMTFVVTNQPDIARGLMDRVELERIHAAVSARLSIDEIACCLHDDRDGCECRKPRPGMVLALVRKWSLDVGRCYLVGDQERDLKCAAAAGCRGILVTRDYNRDLHAENRVDDINSAVEIILSSGGTSIR